ncbi:hypothetical protein DITRI_Ditri19aG0022300 [Diplodiscus trichospermus]
MDMASSRLHFLLALNLDLTLSSAQDNSPILQDCSGDNFTPNSAYAANLNNLLSRFSSMAANDYGFYDISKPRHSQRDCPL